MLAKGGPNKLQGHPIAADGPAQLDGNTHMVNGGDAIAWPDGHNQIQMSNKVSMGICNQEERNDYLGELIWEKVSKVDLSSAKFDINTSDEQTQMENKLSAPTESEEPKSATQVVVNVLAENTKKNQFL
ncbi:hypothetical protein E2562_000203 [Oryza meyeriana var. granulata]|uniref:Uncharacterized protein n=1 Tax=Oryza meyeriana var. granulata TaxID=110450 RepID=A0A6G1DDU4_9ORYZ|nr:hypothetical protein E2562_000203 [Oryza meyeriana var. granulata]